MKKNLATYYHYKGHSMANEVLSSRYIVDEPDEDSYKAIERLIKAAYKSIELKDAMMPMWQSYVDVLEKFLIGVN